METPKHNTDPEQKAKEQFRKIIFTEGSFYHLFENMLHGFAYCKVLFDENQKAQDYSYLFVNSAYESLTGLKDVTGKNASELMPGLKESDSALFEAIDRVIASGTSEKFEAFVAPLNGWFSVSIYSPEKGHFAAFVNNITERKEAEAKVTKLNRLYAFISQINQTIVHVKDEQALFNKTCKIALEFGKFKIAWIGLIDRTNQKISMTEECGMTPEDLDLFNNVSYVNGGPQDQAIRTGTSYICNDIENDLKLRHWKPFINRHDIRSCMVLPLKKSGVVIATFNLYSSVVHFFDKEEIALLEEATGDVSFAMDIFEKEKSRIEIEKKKEESEENLKTIFENTSEGFVLLDANCRVKAFNGYAKKYSFFNAGKTLEVGQSIFDNFETSRVPLLKEIMANVLKGETIQYDRSYNLKKNKTLWLHFSIAPVKENGIVKGICVTGQDITEKKLAEQEKEFEQNNLTSLINNTHDLMWSVDRDFKLITFNSAFEQTVKHLSGVTLEKGGSVLANGFSEEELTRFRGYYARAFAGETFTELELSEDFCSEISFYPIYNNKDIIGTACFSRNITENKKNEENLKRSESHLKSANKDLQTFIYRASHDLRGPLSSIIGLANVSRLDITDKKALKYIDMISLSTKKLDDTLAGLVQSMAIKDVAQFEDEINFKELIDDVLDRFQFYEGFSKMKFDVKIDLAAPFISSKLILQPIVQNLIENAIKYRNTNAKQSYADITISETPGEILIAFKDNGLGIDATIQDKIFDVYYKGTQKSKGSGLGLYIVKTAVERLNGSIQLISEPDKGSLFTVKLPKKRVFK